MSNASAAEKQNILQFLMELKDYRRKQGKRHQLHIIMIIIIMAVMSGSKSERSTARFAKNNRDELIDLLKIKEIPSRSVISGAIQNTDFEELEKIFYKWSLQFISIEKGDWINIDGKSIRGTLVNAGNKMQDFVSLVTVFVNKKKQALSAGKINTKKENEIEAVRSLIDIIDLQGVIFTSDALRCQTKTIEKIVSSGNDYIINVKENQKNLLKNIKKLS